MTYLKQLYWNENKTKKDYEKDMKKQRKSDAQVLKEIDEEIALMLKPFEDVKNATDNVEIKKAMLREIIKLLQNRPIPVFKF